MSAIVSPPGEHMNLKTWEELEQLVPEDENEFPESKSDINSVWSPYHSNQELPSFTLGNLWQLEDDDIRKEYISEFPLSPEINESEYKPKEATIELSIAAGCPQYDPLNNLLEKYKEDPKQFFVMCSLYQIYEERDHERGPGLLPERDINDTRKTLVLDMDETLIHCCFQHEVRTQCDWVFTLESGTSMMGVSCWVRPHLERFLEEASKMFELVVFTASQEPYANKVLDLVDPKGFIEHRLFRQHCTQVHGNFVKDLTLLGRPLSDTIIIDNSPVSFAFQPTNGILCDDWYGNQNDCELLQLLPILELVDASSDVRGVLWKICYVGQFLFDLCEALAENDEMWCTREEGAGFSE